ncbi:MAG: NAD(+) kinase, partial [Pseudomonadales bacterium]
LNDVVVHPGSMARMMEFSLWVNDEYVYNQRSDGLIIASPTGSTAYALSAGGPIMHPSLNALVIVPMFPHTLTSRPLVLGGDSELRIVIGEHGHPSAQASCDSQVHQPFAVGDELHVAKYPHALKLLYPLDHSFYESCRSKLDWASRLGGQ